MKGMNMWRQGDVFFERVTEIPANVRQHPLPHVTLVHGEMTGHSHRIADPRTATLFAAGPMTFFLDVHEGGATVVHEEHGPIALEPGLYRVWRQREYSPEAIRVVRD
jgi:hypothetical protein